jgi:hypothetical protein
MSLKFSYFPAPTTTTTPAKVLTACPTTFTSYNVVTNPKIPETLGFSSGTYLDGSTIYVGTGINTAVCFNQDLLPTRLATVKTPSNSGPGAYMECTGGVFSNVNVKYLQADVNLKWVPANTANVNSVVGVVKVTGSYYGYYIGRVTLRALNGTSYKQVSKIHMDRGAVGMWYVTEQNAEGSTNSFEVLACNYYK